MFNKNNLIYFLIIIFILNTNNIFAKKIKIFDELDRISPLKKTNEFRAIEKIENSFHKIFELYENKVVFISTEKAGKKVSKTNYESSKLKNNLNSNESSEKEKQNGLGTGFIISKNGYVCTNFHVVENVDIVKVRVGKFEYNAKVVGVDKITDLALLKIDNEANFDPVYFGDSNSIKVGDWAIAIGNPFGFDKTFTVGVVSAVRGDQDGLGDSYIQTDASINQGNSGGPLINLNGEVVGVNRMIYARQGGGSLGIGFAIPITSVRIVLEQLIQNGRVSWGFIGAQLANLDRNLMYQLNAINVKGAVVVGILQGGPADVAGLVRGDIILRYGNNLVKDANSLIHLVSNTTPNKEIILNVLRNGVKKNLSIKVIERPFSNK